MKLTVVLPLAFLAATNIFATPITYSVAVNTSSLSGTEGSLDLNFNPGLFMTQSATLAIQLFGGNGTPQGTAETIGDVDGSLPSTLTFDNGTAFNDYFQSFTFGSSLNFDFSLSGPALSDPDGVSTSGSAFAFSLFSDAAGTLPALTTDTTDGYGFLIAVNLDGSTTVTNYSNQTTISAIGGMTPPPSMIAPEPASIGLVTIFFAAFLVNRLKLRRQYRSQVPGGVFL